MDIKAPKKDNNICKLKAVKNGEIFSFLEYLEGTGERFWECPYVYIKCSDIYVNIKTGEIYPVNPLLDSYVYTYPNAQVQL